MRAVVLVGGFGTRLRPLTLTTPKPLLPVGHKPVLEHLCANLAAAGIDEVVLSLGFRPDAFLAAYPDGRCAGVRLVYAVEPEPLDTAGAIRFAARFDSIEETFVVFNGDVLTDLDIGTLVDFHHRHGGEASIHLTPVEDPSAFGVVPTAADGRVLAFIEKPKREDAPTNLINGGTYVMEPSVLDRIPGGRRVSIERETFPALVEEGALFAMPTDDYWLDVGRPELYVQANLDLLEGRRSMLKCEPLGIGVEVDLDAVVHNAVVGDRCRVGAGALVVDSVLLPDTVVGAGAEVRSSALGAGVRIGSGAVLVDTVLGDGEVVAPAARLDGVRLPQPA